MLRKFTHDEVESLHPHYADGPPPKFNYSQLEPITRTAPDRPVDHGLPFSVWNLSKLAGYLLNQVWSTRFPMSACTFCCAGRGWPFRCIKTWKFSTDPSYETKAKRVQELYEIADGKAEPQEGDPEVVNCLDEFGPRNPRRLAPATAQAPTSCRTGCVT